MEKNDGVNGSGSQSEADDRGVPIKNLQAEFARKLDDVKGEINSKFDALAQKLDALTVTEERTQIDVPVNEREELLKISAGPRRYVAEFIKPLEEKAEALEKALQEQRKEVLTAQWQRMEDRIARAEGKKDWNELSPEFTKEIRQEIINRGWQASPASAMDVYEIVKARKVNVDSSDPDRIARIRDNQGEGAGRRSGSHSNPNSVSSDQLNELSRTAPSHPDYKKNMETLGKVQKGLIKVEG